MMQDQLSLITLSFSTLAGLAIVAGATLRGWRGWLDLKRAEIDRGGVGAVEAARLPAAERIEMADLKERIRKLEAIAAGVDL